MRGRAMAEVLIQKWRDGLDETKRRSFNHPGAGWHVWRRSCGEQKQAGASGQQFAERITDTADRARRGKPVFWPQDALHRAHRAMLDS